MYTRAAGCDWCRPPSELVSAATHEVDRTQLSEEGLVVRSSGMTVLSLIPRQFAMTTESIFTVWLLPWNAGVLRLRVRAELAYMYPFALENCAVDLELADDQRVPVSLRFEGRTRGGWSRYVVRFTNHHDIPRVRLAGCVSAQSTVRAVEFTCAESGMSERFVNAAIR